MSYQYRHVFAGVIIFFALNTSFPLIADEKTSNTLSPENTHIENGEEVYVSRQPILIPGITESSSSSASLPMGATDTAPTGSNIPVHTGFSTDKEDSASLKENANHIIKADSSLPEPGKRLVPPEDGVKATNTSKGLWWFFIVTLALLSLIFIFT